MERDRKIARESRREGEETEMLAKNTERLRAAAHKICIFIREGKNLQQLYQEIQRDILTHSTVKVEGAGKAVLEVIKVTELLEQNRVARKIAVDTNFADNMSKISVLMTTRLGHYYRPSQRVDYSIIIKQYEKGYHETTDALKRHRYVLLRGEDNDILTAIKITQVLEKNNKARKFSVRTWIPAERSQPRINILMQSLSKVPTLQQGEQTEAQLQSGPSRSLHPSQELVVGAEREQQATEGIFATAYFIPAAVAMSWVDIFQEYRSQI